MIPSPNLDDRTYQEIRDEAIKLIPHYCPEWTNHNPTDPGITLIELFSWMSEMMIYRLNKVPEKMYLTLLDLVGLSLLPPQPSKVLLSFSPVSGYEGEVVVKKGTKVSTSRTESSKSIIFETLEDVKVSQNDFVSFISINKGLISNQTQKLLNTEKIGEGVPLFSGEDEIKRYVYISDPSLAFLVDNNIWNLYFDNASDIKTLQDEIVNFLEWEYWNGKKWVPMESSRSVPGVKKSDNQIFLKGPVEIEETEVNGETGFFVRGSLVSVPEREQAFEINDISMRLIFHGEGINPDMCLSCTGNMRYVPLDLNQDFVPFVDVPKYNDSFYICCEEVLSKEDSEVIINFYLSDLQKIDKPQPNDDLLLKYEYWNGKSWMVIGNSTIDGVHKPQGGYHFLDSTYALTRSGEVKFSRPDDLSKADINGQEKYWIRVRIGAGDFGTGGQYLMNDEGNWEWVYDRPVAPPSLSHIRLRYTAEHKPVEKVLVYNDYKFYNFTKENIVNYDTKKEIGFAGVIKYFNLFEITNEKYPITYLGFSKGFSKGANSLYIRINEKNSVKPQKNPINTLGYSIKKKERPISIKWEYWNGEQWSALPINDYTDKFHQSGFIQFITPEDMTNKSEFNEDLHWIRVVFESGSFEIPPKIKAIHLNSVFAHNEQTYLNELLGSSNGIPMQEFKILHGPLLPGLELIVKESELPPAHEREAIIAEEGEDAISIKKDAKGSEEYWIRYHEVDNFYSSKTYSRHYVVNYKEGTISFGDGQKGIIPPRLANNIRVVSYRTGGGAIGNVGHGIINILRENIPYIKQVTNYYPAEGGADLEDLERLKSRATNVFKNLNRAVTAQDYEWLAKEASTSVGRAKCLANVSKNGEVILIIIPEVESWDFNLKEKILPTSELLRRVKEFIDIRKLVGTKLRVEAPVYKDITVNIKLVFKKNIAEIQVLKERVELLIRRYFHALKGGPLGTGWEFGMPITKNDIFAALEKHDGISYIEEVTIIDDELKAEIEKVLVPDDGLIYVSGVNIIEREYQY